MHRTAIALFAATLLACAPAGAADPAVPALPQAQLQKLLTAYALIKQDYVGNVDDDKLFDGALSGMLAALDAHSQYLNRDDMRDIERETSGDYVGIGVGIEADRERMRVVSVAAGSPAERAHVAPGDVVTAIDGTPVAGLARADVARRMRGAAGTQVTLALATGAVTRSVTIVRAALRDTTVRLMPQPAGAPGIAWIRIEEFGGTTGAELAALLKQLDAGGAPRGLVLDLRNNPGGVLSSAIAAAGAFLPEHAVVFSARGRAPEERRTITVDARRDGHADEADVLAGLPAWTRTVPLTVLVNGSSASAAELLAAALQDHGRAQLVGTPTFGKGSIQSVVPLDADSGVKFTIARYFSPNGHEIQAHGVTPDVIVAPPADANAELLPREADLANHLAPEDGAAAAPRTAAENARHFGTGDDRALRQAVALLAPPPASPALVARLRQLTAGLKAGGMRGGLAP